MSANTEKTFKFFLQELSRKAFPMYLKTEDLGMMIAPLEKITITEKDAKMHIIGEVKIKITDPNVNCNLVLNVSRSLYGLMGLLTSMRNEEILKADFILFSLNLGSSYLSKSSGKQCKLTFTTNTGDKDDINRDTFIVLIHINDGELIGSAKLTPRK